MPTFYGGTGQYLDLALLGRAFGRQGYTPPETYYLALFTVPPDYNYSFTGTELTGSGYSRIAIPNTDNPPWMDPVDSIDYSTVYVGFDPGDEPTFEATDTWPTAVAWGLFTASTGGELHAYGPITPPRQLNDGDRLRLRELEVRMHKGDSFDIRTMEPALVLDALEGLSLVGSKVATWYDLSGNGNHFVQATDARRPTYDADNMWVYFDRSQNQNLQGPALTTGYTTAYYWCLLAELFTGYAAWQKVFTPDFGLSPGYRGYGIDIGTDDHFAWAHATVWSQAWEQPTATGMQIREGAWDAISGTRYVRGAGMDYVRAATYLTGAPTQGDGGYPASLGAYENGVTPAEMRVRHLLVVHGRIPSDEELRSYRAWLLRRYSKFSI